MSVETIDLVSALWQPKLLDFQLLKHVVAGQEATRGQIRQSWALDEANVGGLNLHNGFVATPGNVGFVRAPQVSCCTVSWGQLNI